MKTIKKYGQAPYRVGLLHGGPGAPGEMKPVAERLSVDFGILELFQTKKSINGQIEELHAQLLSSALTPAILIGYSWGAWLGFLFAAKYPALIKKLILVSAGAFESKYNKDLMRIRLDRLNPQERKEAEKLISDMDAGNLDNETLSRFGRLVAIADAFDPEPDGNDPIEPDMEVYQSVWAEAARLRDTGELIKCAEHIQCPVVAIHGDHDPHPIEGVAIPLGKKLGDFKMIRLDQCGHTPWKEKFAKDRFFELLREEVAFNI